ncbi:transcriptional regulator [Aeropyrum pernix]|uniref:Transcriptional regulator n=1 Tax=Aeropyrum pernix TaxID=56636 RepID=A0A401HBK6_AERPX|nr:CRISPR-associated CARF protein Csa3 [Aeropyrum pernix]GBF09752.1 transcriptional regulator [Aeropyrum pernix]
MAGRVFAFTLGFHENFAIRTLSSYSADAADSIVAFTYKPVSGAVKTAFHNLASIAARIGVGDHRLVGLDPGDGLAGMAASMLRHVGDYVKLGAYTRVVFDVTGGPKMLSLSAFIAAMLLSGIRSVEITVQSETAQEYFEKVSGTPFAMFRVSLGREKAAILRYVAEKPGSKPAAIAADMGLSPKTVYNKAGELRRLGLLYRRGRGGGLFPTSWGNLIAAYLELAEYFGGGQ